MIGVEIVPWDVHTALTGALTSGESMEDDARAARDGGEDVLGSFGNAAMAEEAFRAFWDARDSLGLRAAAILTHNASRVADAASEFTAMDQDMTAKAAQTASEDSAARVNDAMESA